ncbi:unnamed protein product [Oncorhynchus mykiss]|uniref:Uncharacterized protein n=1 Tax=Oncorhynchus mykiss TaxID=8022 RepID=A0A060ZCD3_ONCMY|nr:unnamed protein product [Oncorhynchus mykiss]
MITDTISNIRKTTSTTNVNDVKTFIQNICSALEKKLVIKDALESILILNTADTKQFAVYLTEFVEGMKQSLAAKYDKERDIKERLKSLPFKPQDKMFTSLFGCGKQCPFCGAACDAGGKEHAVHFTNIHRPQGLNSVKFIPTNKLVTNICSSDVTSNLLFIHPLVTGEDGHPYKDYRKYYPDWKIDGDPSIKASDYWKYVMATFNETIAKDTDVLPADIPEDWKTLTPGDAMKSLKEAFNMK